MLLLKTRDKIWSYTVKKSDIGEMSVPQDLKASKCLEITLNEAAIHAKDRAHIRKHSN